MKKNRLFILLILTVFIFSCAEKKTPTNQSESVQKTQTSPSKITYFKIKKDFTRRVDKGFAIVTLDLKTGIETEYKNHSYKKYVLMDSPNLHPSGKKVVTHIRRTENAPRTIVEVELEGGEVRELLNIAPQSLLPRYSPEGDRIVYQDPMNEDNHTRVVIYDIDEEKGEHLPCNGLRCWQPDWHPDGTKVVFVEDSKKLIEYDLSSNTKTTRYALKESQSGIEIVDPRYSPDGESILFLESKIKNISPKNYREQDVDKLILLDKQDNTTEVFKRKGIGSVEWCTDSKHFIYSLFNFNDRKNMSELHLLKLNEKSSTIIKSFDQKYMKLPVYCS